MNIAVWLARAGRNDGQAPALAVGNTLVMDYHEMARRCAGLAGALRAVGLRAGDRVALVARNHPAYLEVIFGAWWAGLAVVPVNAKLHPSEVEWIVGHADARVVFVTSDIAPSIARLDLPGVIELIELGSRTYGKLTRSDAQDLVARAGDDLAWLFYTSGTTGRPKGAMLTHRNLLAMSLAHLTDLDPTRPGDALLHCAPLSHGSGLLSPPHVARRGLNVVPESGGFEPSEVLAVMQRWRNASIFVAPTMLRRLVSSVDALHAESARTIIWGGAPMHVADAVEALEKFGPCLAQLYGQGESPMTITALTKADVADREHPRWIERLASAGTARSVVEIRVAREDGSEPEPGDPGEVLVRGETVMAGYWGDSAATAAAIRDGWLHTGDIGMIDELGYLTLKDRSKDVIISGGSNIYPREVEEVLAAHPAVREVSVIGRSDPDWGEIVVAYVVGDTTAENLDRLCLNHIARFKRPKAYVFVPELPKNNYGKVLKTQLRTWDAGHERTPGAHLAERSST